MNNNATKTVISLLEENKMYVIKQGKIIEHELPDYGEVTVVMHNGKVDRLEETKKRKV
ncbi:DUF3954 domain-containing protein [Bacillus sp. VT-16-64]|nr:DUF3954 domain-containing protein [Bacillus sp. VT-16-64]